MTQEKELCVLCGEETGWAGEYEDSIFAADGTGPLCEDCFEDVTDDARR